MKKTVLLFALSFLLLGVTLTSCTLDEDDITTPEQQEQGPGGTIDDDPLPEEDE